VGWLAGAALQLLRDSGDPPVDLETAKIDFVLDETVKDSR